VIVHNARIATFDAANRVIDAGSVEVRGDGSIGEVGADRPGDFDAGGKLLMPALINCHTHLYSTFARGMALPGRPPRDFREILKKLWWRLDCALDYEDVYYSALVGLIDSVKCGVGTLADHHSSPNACAGSLDRIEQAFREVGLRGALCYETSDRNGRAKAGEGIRENIRFIERSGRAGTVAASFGLHAAFTLGDRTLGQSVEASRALGAGLHVHVAEDRCDAGAVRRLDGFGALDGRTVAAHCVHVTAAERKLLARAGASVVHNPQSNLNNAVGTAKVAELIGCGVLVGLGSDGYTPRMWDEFRTALHLQKHVAFTALANNREIAKKAWGMEIGRIETGARADLILVDYYPPTPLDAGNLAAHLVFGISNAPVDSLMADGRWVMREKRICAVDERAVAEKAAARAAALWRKIV
jgi:putative selenium metabolism protein SsnA